MRNVFEPLFLSLQNHIHIKYRISTSSKQEGLYFFTQAGKLLFQYFRVSYIFFSTILPIYASLPDVIKLSYVRKLPITIKNFKEWFNLIIVFLLVMRAYVLIGIPFWMNDYNLSSKELNVVRNKRNSCLLLKPILNFIRESS